MGRLPDLVRDLLAEFRPLIRAVERAAILLIGTFVAVTVLPARPSGFSFAALSGLGWIRDSLAVIVLHAMERSLTPRGVQFIVLGPFDAFSAVMEIGLYLAIAVTLPYVGWELVRWTRPGLKPSEDAPLGKLLALGTGLFVAGVAFAWFVVLPPIYLFSYQLAPVVGASPTLSLSDFVETTFAFLFLLGLAFELPVACLGLSFVGVLNSETMARRWNWAGIGCVVLAFLISPGVGGGVVELAIALLLFGLYALSYFLVRRLESSRRRGEASSVAA